MRNGVGRSLGEMGGLEMQGMLQGPTVRPEGRFTSSTLHFFSGRNQFITSAQMPPVATPDSSTFLSACGRLVRISGTCDTPSPRASETAMISSARRSSLIPARILNHEVGS